MGKAPGPKPGAPAPPRTRRRHSTVEDPRMGRVSTWPIQSFVLYLSDAFDTDACAPVRSKNIFTFWSMSEMGFRSRGRVGRIESNDSILPTPSSSTLVNLGIPVSCPAGDPWGQRGAKRDHSGTTGTPDSTLSRAYAPVVAWRTP